MGKSTPSAPPPPDPYATARAQTASNVSTSIANTVMGNANETSPLGTVRYNQTGSYKLGEQVLDAQGNPRVTKRWEATAPGVSGDPDYISQDGTQTLTTAGGRWIDEPMMTYRDIPTWERVVELSPEQQGLYDRQNQVQTNLLDLAGSQSRRLQETLANPLSLDGLPAARNTLLATQLRGDVADVGGAQRTFADVGGPQTTFADVGGPQRAVGPTDFSADRQRVEDALYARLTPQLDRDRSALENNLVNQGFQRGTEAFRTEMDSSNRAANDARLGVIAAGGQEQSRLAGLEFQRFGLENAAQQQAYDQALGRGTFANAAQQQAYEQALARATFYNSGQQQDFDQAAARRQIENAAISGNNAIEAQRAQFENTARERALQERMAIRNAPINEISALLGSSQVQMPQFSPFQSSPMAPTPVGDYVYRSADIAQKNYQSELASRSAGFGGMTSLLGTLGSAAIKWSDRRLKRGIEKAGHLPNGLTIHAFRYLWSDDLELGLMADEVRRVRPDAVMRIGEFDAVDYDMAVI